MPRMQTNFKGLIQIVAKNLYPEADVFIRELVQNAHDAIQFRRCEEPHIAGRIDITTDPGRGVIEFSDNGLGLDAPDIEQFLSTLGVSGTGEKTRQLLAASDKQSALGTIGQFGIGILSAFVVADKLEVITRKIGSPKAFRWT